MARAMGAAVQVALLGGAGAAFARGRVGGRLRPRREAAENRLQAAEVAGIAADHEAVSPRESPHAAAGADVHVVQSLSRHRFGPPYPVLVVGVTTVDDEIAGFHPRCQRVQQRVHASGGDHDPDAARRLQGAQQRLQGFGSGGAFGNERRHIRWLRVVYDASVPVTHETPYHIGAHAPETDHAELHWLSSPKRSCMGAGDGLYSCPRRALGHAVPCLRRLYHTRLSALADLNGEGGLRRRGNCP